MPNEVRALVPKMLRPNSPPTSPKVDEMGYLPLR